MLETRGGGLRGRSPPGLSEPHNHSKNKKATHQVIWRSRTRLFAFTGKKTSGDKEYKEIQIVTEDNDLIASITDSDVTEKDGYKVVFVGNED